MNSEFYTQLTHQIFSGEDLSSEVMQEILISPEIEILPLLMAAYDVRKKYVGKGVTIHILNNAQNGHCPEDCNYCAQAKTSEADIEEYPLKSDEEILAEARSAHERGAHRYCMVFAGRGPSQKRIDHLSRLIREIKSQYPIEVCVSPGLLDEHKARQLKEAGLDRLNHNLNTSAKNYSKICTTHTYADRLNTLQAAHNVGLDVCAGVIVGMGESPQDIIEVALKLHEIKAASIPINFFMPIPGVALGSSPDLTPEYCLRVLCLFRFLNPKAEIRMAAGREMHLRSMEALGLYPANSLFIDGYLNAKGEGQNRTLQMIKDAGFTLESEYSLDDLIENNNTADIPLKNLKDLRSQKTS